MRGISCAVLFVSVVYTTFTITISLDPIPPWLRESEDSCPRLEKVGCFHDTVTTNADRVFPNELVNRRDRNNNNFDGTLISWKAYTESVEGLACACAKAAKAKGWKYFGLQFFGECWSGPTLNPGRDGVSEKCTGSNFKPCIDSDERKCIGKAKTNYVYKVIEDIIYHSPIDGGWTDWSSWSACSKTCGSGKRIRSRSCTNPWPAYGGQECLENATEEEICNTDRCEPDCNSQMDIGIILDASTSMTRKNWDGTLKFVNHMSKHFKIGPYNVKFGVIRFAWKPDMVFKFSDKTYWTHKSFDDKVSEIRYTYGVTRPDRALEMAEQELMCATCGIRKKAHKALLIFTDGVPSQNSAPLDKAAAGLKKDGVTIVAVGVGNVNQENLNKIATDANHVLTWSVELGVYKEDIIINRLIKLLCNRGLKFTVIG